jgi:hypothetical protein
MMPMIASDTEVAWEATLDPFSREFPPGTDWITFVRSKDPDGAAAEAVRDWTWADERNPALKIAIPGQFMRGTVIKNANRDLAIAAGSGFSATFDPLHTQVVAQRFNDEGRWRLGGYSVPVLYPQVGELPWEAIAELRTDPNIARFRATLREVEEETAAEAAAGDFEAAAHHAYERHLAAASGRLDGVGAIAKRTGLGLIIGGTTGAGAIPIAGPLGVVVSAVAGAGIGTILDVRNVIRQRRSRGWIEVHHKITGM